MGCQPRKTRIVIMTVHSTKATCEKSGTECNFTAKDTYKHDVICNHKDANKDKSSCEVVPGCKFTAAAVFECTVKRKAADPTVANRENKECSGRGLCNRKTAECNCFDGYTGLSCDTVA